MQCSAVQCSTAETHTPKWTPPKKNTVHQNDPLKRQKWHREHLGFYLFMRDGWIATVPPNPVVPPNTIIQVRKDVESAFGPYYRLPRTLTIILHYLSIY